MKKKIIFHQLESAFIEVNKTIFLEGESRTLSEFWLLLWQFMLAVYVCNTTISSTDDENALQRFIALPSIQSTVLTLYALRCRGGNKKKKIESPVFFGFCPRNLFFLIGTPALQCISKISVRISQAFLVCLGFFFLGGGGGGGGAGRDALYGNIFNFNLLTLWTKMNFQPVFLLF